MNELAKKSLGQHWLRDEAALTAMLRAGEIAEGDVVLEVGPGHGSLTRKLLDAGVKVVAVELDRSLVSKLKTRLPSERLEIINADILEYDLNDLPGDYKLVANIPYYITAQLLRLLTTTANPPKLATLLVQKEVAERLSATPGSLSIIGVIAQNLFDVTALEIVKAELFSPPPKVDSQIITLKLRDKPQLPEAAIKLVKAGFAAKRKTLVNNLASATELDKSELARLVESVGLPSSVRAQHLSHTDWRALSELVKI